MANVLRDNIKKAVEYKFCVVNPYGTSTSNLTKTLPELYLKLDALQLVPPTLQAFSIYKITFQFLLKFLKK